MSWDKARCSNLRSGRRGDTRDDSKRSPQKKKAVVGNSGAGVVRQAEGKTRGRSLQNQKRWWREESDDVIKRFRIEPSLRSFDQRQWLGACGSNRLHYGLREWSERLTCAESICTALKLGRLASVRAKVLGFGKLPAQPTRHQLTEGY